MKSIIIFSLFVFCINGFSRKATPTCLLCKEFYEKGKSLIERSDLDKADQLNPSHTANNTKIILEMQKLFVEYIPQIVPLDTPAKVNAIIDTWLLIVDINPVGDVASVSKVKRALRKEGFSKLQLRVSQRVAIEKDERKKAQLQLLRQTMRFAEMN